MNKPTFNIRAYRDRQKIMMVNLTEHPDKEYSLLEKVIVCYRDKPEWIMVCNANGWDC